MTNTRPPSLSAARLGGHSQTRARRGFFQQLRRAGIGELVGHSDLVTTARTYTHVVADEAELDYARLIE